MEFLAGPKFNLFCVFFFAGGLSYARLTVDYLRGRARKSSFNFPSGPGSWVTFSACFVVRSKLNSSLEGEAGEKSFMIFFFLSGYLHDINTFLVDRE